MSPNTERGYRTALIEAALLAGDAEALPTLEVLAAAVAVHKGKSQPPPQETSSVEPWRDPVETMLARGAGPRAIYDALRTEHGYAGSHSAIKRFCGRLRRERGPRPRDVAIPVDTEPGEVAQVDFGYLGKLYDPIAGVERKAWVFVMVLGYSRYAFAEITFDQKVETWVAMHVRAFQFFGAVPAVVVPDNLKAAVIRAAFGSVDDLALNRTYRELARHYGFKIDPTPPRSPKHKGKVESCVKYVKNNFFKPRSFSDVAEARPALRRWLDEVANQRIHGTTGRQPAEAFESDERARLQPLPPTPYEVVVWKQAKLHTDCHLFFAGRLYSAPWPLVGQQLWVRATPSTVTIYDDAKRVATHDRRGAKRRSTVNEHLPEHRRDYRERTQSYWLERAALLGEGVATYIEAVFDADDVLCQLRTVQAMVKHLETFPKDRARRACARALHFGAYKYGALKTILRKGLDFDPLPEPPAAGALPEPKFARSPSEIINPNLDLFESSNGGNHEYH